LKKEANYYLFYQNSIFSVYQQILIQNKIILNEINILINKNKYNIINKNTDNKNLCFHDYYNFY